VKILGRKLPFSYRRIDERPGCSPVQKFAEDVRMKVVA
jgi:hypothetical protein